MQTFIFVGTGRHFNQFFILTTKSRRPCMLLFRPLTPRLRTSSHTPPPQQNDFAGSQPLPSISMITPTNPRQSTRWNCFHAHFKFYRLSPKYRCPCVVVFMIEKRRHHQPLTYKCNNQPKSHQFSASHAVSCHSSLPFASPLDNQPGLPPPFTHHLLHAPIDIASSKIMASPKSEMKLIDQNMNSNAGNDDSSSCCKEAKAFKASKNTGGKSDQQIMSIPTTAAEAETARKLTLESTKQIMTHYPTIE